MLELEFKLRPSKQSTLWGKIMEYVVTLHGENDVVTAYSSDQQAEAILQWQQYVSDGKFATLSVD